MAENSFDWECLEKIAGVTFTEILRRRVELGMRAAFEPKPPGTEHFERIVELTEKLQCLLKVDAEWPTGYLDDPKYSPIHSIAMLHRVAEGQAVVMSLRNPTRGGRPSQKQRDTALERHVVWAWREAGGKRNGFHSGGDSNNPSGLIPTFGTLDFGRR